MPAEEVPGRSIVNAHIDNIAAANTHEVRMSEFQAALEADRQLTAGSPFGIPFMTHAEDSGALHREPPAPC